MADFVAVIRKAVDGLANNTPENRAKVYDKARSAVVRQLENMKPRPPEELLRRQILKLDTAIAEVEGEYAEALPATEEEQDDLAPAAADVSSPYYEESVAEEQRYVDEPDTVEPVRLEPEHQPEPEAVQHNVHEPSYHSYEAEPREEERYVEREPVEEPPYRATETEAEPEPYHVAEVEPEAEPYKPADPYRDEAPTYFTTNAEEVQYAPVQQEPVAEEEHAHRDRVGQDTPAEEPWHKQDGAAVEHYEEVPRHDEEPVAHQPADEVLHENTHLPFAAGYNSQANYYDDVHVEPDHKETEDERYAAEPVAFHDDRQHFEEPVQQDKPKQAVVEDFSSYFQDTALDLPPKTSPALPRADEDPFAVESAKKDDKERTPWDDLEDLIGYDGGANDRGEKASNSNFDSGFTSEGIPAAAYATKKKKRRNYAGLVLGLGVLFVLAGGGYALWTNRDALNDMVGGLVNSAQTGGTTETASAPANGSTTPAPTQPATTGQQQSQPTTPPAAAPTDDGSVTGTKFTQRLLADGTERDEGAGPGANGQPVTAEGQSVYQQNEAPAQTNATTPAPAGQTPAQQAPATTAATGDRIFLYEEVLGQTVPTAIEGTVSWSLQSEQDDAGKPSSTVQGQINIPGRGLSALITFKRNTDPSLPASHLVEIVFSVSPGFEGGAIDSVQRIAMKSTEQDRGNALIAVPAKITDDFHMIALNDFPDARKTNLELMRTRDWIDIPVAYRNGRRALLTLQKGADGKAAFDTALREWTAAAPADGQ